jgi:hypothetical protein
MTDLTVEPNQLGSARPQLEVICGGRAALERAAMDAVFFDPEQVPVIMAKLTPRRGRLTQVGADASRVPSALDQ